MPPHQLAKSEPTTTPRNRSTGRLRIAASGSNSKLVWGHATLQALTNLLYPPTCVLCHMRLTSRGPVCQSCVSQMPRVRPPTCVRCGLGLPGAFDAQVVCRTCQRTPRAFDTARAPWWYAGAVPEAIRQFKYHRRWRIGQQLAEDMVSVARTSLPLNDIDAVVPVPLHWLKRRLKGFDPTVQLATAVATSLEKPCLPRALFRRRWTATQTRLGWTQRFRNVDQAFGAHQRSVEGQTLLLIDDVLTSGATVHACTRALKTAGAHTVFVLTAARTPLDHGK